MMKEMGRKVFGAEEAGVPSNRRPLSAAIMLDCKKETESSIQHDSLKPNSFAPLSVSLCFNTAPDKIHKEELPACVCECVYNNDSDALFTLLQKPKF